MAYCPDCGVEIGKAPLCPLCGAKNPRADAKGEGQASCGDQSRKDAFTAGSPADARRAGARFADAKPSLGFSSFFGEGGSSQPFTPREKNQIAWEVLSVAFAIATAVLAAINFLVDGGLSWSLYPIASFVFVWVIATAFLLMEKRPRLRYFLAAVDPVVFLLALGCFTGDLSWAWRLALPITIFVEFVIAGVALHIKNAKRKGLNIIAYLLVGAALVCLGIEIFIDLFVAGKIALGWSAITAIALVPIAAFLIYLHYRVAKSTNLRRLFKL